MSYFNAEQQAYMEELDRMPLTERCWCGWNRVGKCSGVNCKPDRTCADKCLPCYGMGKRWVSRDKEPKMFETCPDCSGSGLSESGHERLGQVSG
jgi:hypothetical protein